MPNLSDVREWMLLVSARNRLRALLKGNGDPAQLRGLVIHDLKEVISILEREG